jgi:hypothetical protein
MLQVGDELAGHLVKCQVCGNPFRVKPLNDDLQNDAQGFEPFQESETQAGSADTDSDMPLMSLPTGPKAAALTSRQAAPEQLALSASSQAAVSIAFILAFLVPPILSGVVAWRIADGLSGFMWLVVFVGAATIAMVAVSLSAVLLASTCIGIKGLFERRG